MFSVNGKVSATYKRSNSMPGPGSYNPSSDLSYKTPFKPNFGTSTRDDAAKASKSSYAPGPGAYNMQNYKGIGSDGPKLSSTSRRQRQDLYGYVVPGPGSYNAH